MRRDNLFYNLIAFCMCLIIAIMGPLQTYAASGETYISEMKLAYGNTAEEAKTWLEKEGYQVVDQDLNADTGDTLSDAWFNKKRSVYLGYKTTQNPQDAIRDIKTMNMKGNYSFDDYQKLLEKEKDEIILFLDDFFCTLNEYRTNYKNGVSKAKIAHDSLNMLYDDDTGKYIGDLLLNQTKQEMTEEAYDALSAEEKKNHADMVTILMQANGKAVLAIEQNLYLGADDDMKASFVDRLAVVGDYATFENEFISSFSKSISINELDKKMDIAYGDTAALLAEKIEDFKEYMEMYSEHELYGEEDEDKIAAYFTGEKEMDFVFWNNARSIYQALHEIPYEDDNLYDFLTGEEYDLMGEDQYLLYPMASVLSAGQITCLPYVSFVQMFNEAIANEEGCKQLFGIMNENMAEGDLAASIYEGVNRSVFTSNSVAVTTSAREMTNSGEKSYIEQWLGYPVSNLSAVLLGMSIVSGFASFTAHGISSHIAKQCDKTLKELKSIKKVVTDYGDDYDMELINPYYQTFEEVEIDMGSNNILTQLPDELKDLVSDGGEVLKYEVGAENDLNNKMVSTWEELHFSNSDNEEFQRWNNAYNKYNAQSSNSKIARYIGRAFCAAAIILLVISFVSGYRDLEAYYHQKRTPIPEYMVDSTTGDGKIKNYTYYKAVTCNRLAAGFDTSDIADDPDILGEYGDLKGDIGKEWLTLYYTKNEEAGSPITTDILVQVGSSDLKVDYLPLSMFGTNSMVNLNDEDYCYSSSAPSIYLMYKVDNSADMEGSIFGGENGLYGMLVVFGAVLGCAVLVAIFRRKKRKVAEI